MDYFISDLHIGHTNAIRLCNRPYASVEEMDRSLVDNWNSKVKKNDTVYIVGDCFWIKKNVDYYLNQLKGKKVLVLGNHDNFSDYSDDAKEHFDIITPYLEINVDRHAITLCHYPMLEWKFSRSKTKSNYLIHGHIHNRILPEYTALFVKDNALNAGVDINGFCPVTLEELITNNRAFKQNALKILSGI